MRFPCVFLRNFSIFSLLALIAPAQRTLAAQTHSDAVLLKSGWVLQSSSKVPEAGHAISLTGFPLAGWYPLSAPGTVFAGLIENKVYPDPYFGMNLRKIPGVSYPIGGLFSNLPMPADSPFRVSWWYRTEFPLTALAQGKRVWLHLDGVNYRANIWLNGMKIASAQQIAGAMRMYELDVTAAAHPGGANALAIEIFPPRVNDLGITFVDWNPGPPDKSMGLWRDVSISLSGPVAVRHPHVLTKLDLPSLDVAHLTVTAELRNASNRLVQGTLRGWVEGVRFEQEVALEPLSEKTVSFTPAQFPQLNLAHPRLWWPYRMGDQNLYDLELTFESGGEISDLQVLPFGIDQFTSQMDSHHNIVFSVNGKRILIRGAAWTPDMLLRRDSARLDADFRYVREMNLNAIRLEGKLDNEDFFARADRAGILLMPGWCCCDHWEQWKKWNPENKEIAAASLADQIRRLRNHPSVFVWLNGSDGPPPADIERMYLGILKKYDWTRPVVSSASQEKAKLSGPSGVKMTGPYDYVPPLYWYEGLQQGGARGFNTETSPGPAIPPVESLRKMFPAEKLWPPNEMWAFHAGGERFKDTKRFDKALAQRYGPARGLADYLWKSEAMAYEGQRAMFEAYGRNKYEATGVIQWMLNNAWPSLIWHLYDYFMRPAAGYFGTRKACEPLHAQYSYDDGSVVVVNDYPRGFENLKLRVKVYDLNLKEVFSRESTLASPPDSSLRAFVLPAIPGLTTTYFLRLGLDDAAGKTVSRNFYWLSTKADVLDYPKTFDTVYTPEKSFGDLTALQKLTPVKLTWTSKFTPDSVTAANAMAADGSAAANTSAHESATEVRITNPSATIAFLVRLKVTRGKDGQEILPVWWDDNYFELFPGETREIRASYRASDAGGVEPVLAVDGWNVSAETH